MNKKLFIVLIVFEILFHSCKNETQPCNRIGVIRDLLGQDGCTLVIEDKQGEIFVPVNIFEFGLTYYEGQKILYSFQLYRGSNPCNIGVPVTLLCIDINQ